MKPIIKFMILTMALMLVFTACQKQDGDIEVTLKSSVAPVKWVTPRGGNVECNQLNVVYQLTSNRVNWTYNENSGLWYFDGPFPAGFSVSTDGTYLNWSYEDPDGKLCLDGISVIVKGGNAANVYTYNVGVNSDEGLNAPLNASGKPAGLSNITFCYNLKECEKELVITVKVIAENGIWGITDGEEVFNQGSCEFIGINPYPFTTDLIINDPYWGFQMGTVSLIDSKIKITLNAGLTLTAGYIFIGTKADLIDPMNLINGCPDYQNWTLYQDWD